MATFSGSGNIGEKILQLFTDPKAAWDEFKTGGQNQLNAQIADENMNYQRERNAIEDARYEEETAYNRAFAEDERDYQRAFAEDERAYNRALQQQLFDREDTAILRQAQQLSALGINPLSQQLNGVDAGQVVGGTSAGAGTAPTASTRGGSAIHNGFQQTELGMLPILSSMLSLASTVNGVKTGEYNRDALALQNDKQFLENLDYANQLGIDYDGYFLSSDSNKKHYTNNSLHFSTPDGKSLFDTPEYKASNYSKYRKNRFDSMPSWQYTLDQFANNDVYNQAEKALTNGANLFDKVYDNISEKKESKFNPFRSLLNLFY